MTNDIQDEFDISENELIYEEDTNQPEDILAYEQLNQKLQKMLINILKYIISF